MTPRGHTTCLAEEMAGGRKSVVTEGATGSAISGMSNRVPAEQQVRSRSIRSEPFDA